MNMLLPILIHQEARLHHNPKSVCRTQNVFSMLQNSSFVITTTIWYILQISRIITNYKEYLNVACVDHIKFKHRISYSRTSPYKWQQTLWRVFFEKVMTDMNIFTYYFGHKLKKDLKPDGFSCTKFLNIASVQIFWHNIKLKTTKSILNHIWFKFQNPIIPT